MTYSVREDAALKVSRADELRAQADTLDRAAVKLLRDAGIESPPSYSQNIAADI